MTYGRLPHKYTIYIKQVEFNSITKLWRPIFWCHGTLCSHCRIQSKLKISMVSSNDFPAGIRKEMIRFERNNKILASGDHGSIGGNYFFPEHRTSEWSYSNIRFLLRRSTIFCKFLSLNWTIVCTLEGDNDKSIFKDFKSEKKFNHYEKDFCFIIIWINLWNENL